MGKRMTATNSTAKVETLLERIGTLVAERQRLREDGASDRALEGNRREIAELQQQLSRALIDLYLPKDRKKAA
ncbi:MAG: hypothetical protein C5B48_09905 [Candidatus Rokuibacteriota bacterium]|nr:MAG: hypothetical protein C5B48_09905 [Candidatus Rokubacteria bacterium]